MHFCPMEIVYAVAALLTLRHLYWTFRYWKDTRRWR